MAIPAAISTEVADAVHAEALRLRERAREHERQLRSEAISAAARALVLGEQERAREHERQLRSEAISAAVEEERRDVVYHVAEGERVHVAKGDVPPSTLSSRPPGSGIFGQELPSVLLSALQSKVECRFSRMLPDQGEFACQDCAFTHSVNRSCPPSCL